MHRSTLNDTGRSFNNTTMNSSRMISMVGPRLPTTTPPIRQIVQLHDKIKYNYYIKSKQEQAIEQQKRASKIQDLNGRTENHKQLVNQKESKIYDDSITIDLSQIRVERDPTPTQPIRSLHKNSLMIPPSQVQTRSASTSRTRERPSSAPRINVQKRIKTVTENEIYPRRIASAATTPRSNSPDKHEHSDLAQWIESLGVCFNEDTRFDSSSYSKQFTEDELINSIKNGTKLAEIVEKLELKEIRGIDKKPIRTGAIVNNLNRVLEILRNRKNMNPRYLWSNKEIMQGDKEVIWGLLYDMQQEYTKNVKKKNRMNTSLDSVNISRNSSKRPVIRP